MSMSSPLIEKAVDPSGKLLWKGPYMFNRLLAVGQEQVRDSKTYTTISCEKRGHVIVTVLRETEGAPQGEPK